jgi:feruloyl esterase
MMGSNPQSGLTRPLCAYPQYAKYKGSGDVKDAKNWACTQ